MLLTLGTASSLILFAVTAWTQSPMIALPPVYASGTIGVTGGNSARWNVLNPAQPAPLVGATCSVKLSFHTAAGEVLKTSEVTVKPGESASLVLSDAEIPSIPSVAPVHRALIYATAILPVSGPINQPTATCSVLATLELFDNTTAKTEVVLPGKLVEQTGLWPLATQRR